MATAPLCAFSPASLDETPRRAVAHGGVAPYLPAMLGEHGHSKPGNRSAIFSRAEVRWLWAIVIAAVVVSATAALVSDLTIADVLGGGPEPAPQQTNAED